MSFAGCLGRGTEEDQEGTADTINVAGVEGEGALFRNLVDEFVEDDTGVDVNIELLPFDGLFERAISVLDNEGDEFDIFLMDDPWFPRLARHLDPIEQWLPSDVPEEYIEPTVDIATWPTPNMAVPPGDKGSEPELRGLVVVGNCVLFGYNAEYLDRVGEEPPETWDDVVRVGRAIDNEIDGASGFAIRGERGNPVMANYYPIGVSNAGLMFEDDWRFNWASQEGIDAVDLFANDLAEISPQGTTAFDSDEVITAIGSGEAGQALLWPAAADTILDDSAEGENIEFTVVPEGIQRGPTQGNWIAAINAYTSDPRKRAAGEVLRSFVSREAQDIYVEQGGIPFRHDIFEEYSGQAPWFDTLYESLQEAVPRPRTPEWNEIEEAMGVKLNDVLVGNLTPEETINESEEDITEILERSGYYE
jgi:multiple sugar transport system substrate-binding protein